MLISHEWLSEFVPHGLSPEALRDLITTHVATVDTMERTRQDLRGIVVARVIEAGPHPDSDHLWVTKVDDGSGTVLDVVCGAPNVTVGTLYPFARTGTVLPGGLRIERRKIRGAVSNGMLCSPDELGLGTKHDGIMELSVNVAPGTPFLDAVDVGDVRYEIDVLPNRPDLLSHAGLAREVAALTRTTVRTPQALDGLGAAVGAAAGEREAASSGATVRVEDAAGCPRYMALVIRDVHIGESPEWLRTRLESVGLRSISNVVDATNYMLVGYGQPMHAFDLAKVTDQTVVVRRARRGERIVTLDGVDRALDERMTIIADAGAPIAVAGVLGGRDSEVTAATTDILLEVAYFDPRQVRIARRALGLSTDASYRFERGVDPTGTAATLARAGGLIAQLTGGRIGDAPIEVGAAPARPGAITLRAPKVSRLLGATVDAREISDLLSSVGFAVEATTAGEMRVSPPSWRHDVARDVDLIEEVARLRGYDALPDAVRPFRPGTVRDHPLQLLRRRVRDHLVGRGLFEVRPLPFVSGDDSTHTRIVNPLADDEPHLRTSLLETAARRAEFNLNRMQGDIRIFEIGSAFAPTMGSLPAEEVRVAALIMGARRPPHFTEPRPPAFDMWDAKALGEELAAVAHPGERITLVPAAADMLWRIVRADSEIGVICRVALDRPVWASEAFGVELLLTTMSSVPVAPPGENAHQTAAPSSPRRPSTFRPLPTTPAAEFDIALLLPEGLDVANVERVIRSAAGELLERLDLFDEYRGPGVEAGYRSVGWRLTFRDPIRTLRDKEIEGRRARILKALEGELGVRPRSV